LHVAVLGPSAPGVGPPYCCVCLEPSTGTVLELRALEGAKATTAMEAFEETLWGMVESHLRRVPEASGGDGPLGEAAAWKPALVTTFDVALADYLHALLQGSGLDVVCVDREGGFPVQFPRKGLVTALWGGQGVERAAEGTLLLKDVVDQMVARLEEDRALPWAAGEGVSALGACQAEQCMSLHRAGALLRCTGCMRAAYCSRECQSADWKRGGHRERCKEIQAGAAPSWA